MFELRGRHVWSCHPGLLVELVNGDHEQGTLEDSGRAFLLQKASDPHLRSSLTKVCGGVEGVLGTGLAVRKVRLLKTANI